MDLVFPSADYSRFAHSLGACHVLGKILDNLTTQKDISKVEWQELRLAMLLHDIGHYPMSHPTEIAVKRFYTSASVTEANGEVDVNKMAGKFVKHEPLGRKILENDDELKAALQGFDPIKIGGIFAREIDSPLKNLVSSELDADRLDYLMRSSQATGLPYGHYDRDYLVQNLRFDSSGMVCLDMKALRAADHYLMCRAFDYMQTIYHKSVVGLEQMLQHCVVHALDLGLFKMSEESLEQAIVSKEWHTWDDKWLLDQLASLEGNSSAVRKVKSMARRVRERKPAKCIWMTERLVKREKANDEEMALKTFLESVIEQDPRLSDKVITWHKGFSPTDVSPSQRSMDPDDYNEDQNKLIRIKERDGISRPLIAHSNSLMNVLGERKYIFGRVYFVGEDAEERSAHEVVTSLAHDESYSDGCR